MAKGYWVANIDVTDMEGYRKTYVAANAGSCKKFGAAVSHPRRQIRGVEGKLRSRVVVIEFPELSAALDCYASPEYQEGIKRRLPHSTGDIVVLEGYDGPQP